MHHQNLDNQSLDNQRADNWDAHWLSYAESAEKNPAQKLRRNVILSYIPDDTKRILDIGSGQGDLLLDISVKCPKSELYGIEYSQGGIVEAQRKLPRGTFIQHDCLLPLNYDLPTFDVAICSEVLEHVEKPSIFLKNIVSLIKPLGFLLVTVPSGPKSAFDTYIGHRKHYTKKELIGLLDSSGYEVTTCRAIGFPFFNIYKLIVILRGKKLITDVAKTQGKTTSKLALFVMWCFDILFKFNIDAIPLGWQLIAIAVPKQALQDLK